MLRTGPARSLDARARTVRQAGSTARGYGYRWQKFRRAWLAQHPLCVMCRNEGRVTAATDVDHVVPHRGDMRRFWAGPFQSLCHAHHSEKTAREDGGFGREPSAGGECVNCVTNRRGRVA